MRFSLAVTVVLAGISASGLAQQDNTFKVKPAHAAEKTPKRSAPVGKAVASPATASSSAAKDLQNVEHQTAKSAASRSAGQKAPGIEPAKPAKDKPTPPINFRGTGSAKKTPPAKPATNPYQGRLRQKHPQP